MDSKNLSFGVLVYKFSNKSGKIQNSSTNIFWISKKSGNFKWNILNFGIFRVQLIMVLFFGYPVRFTTFDRDIQLVHTGRPIWNTTKVNWDFGVFHTNNVTSFLKFERKKNQKYSLNTYDMNTPHLQQMILYQLLWDFIWDTLYINTYIPNSFIVQFCSLQTYTTHQFHKVYKKRLLETLNYSRILWTLF